MGLLIRTLLIALSFGFLTMGGDAFARAGGKRSFGQRSHPTTQPRQQPNNPPPHQQQMQPPPSNRGGFMKGLAGGLAGGLLGSMLFSSLAHGAGFGGAGGGIGFLDILLIAGLLYFVYRFWKSRQARPAFAGGAPSMGQAPMSYQAPGMDPASATMARSAAYGNSGSDAGYFAQGASPYAVPAASLDRDTAEDIFFRVQGAWTRRDLTSVQDYVEQDVARVLEADLQDLKARHEINRLENISVRNIEISEHWYEGGRDLVRVRFTASLLDYTVDESAGALKSGSNSEPVKFDEYWIFAKSQGRSSWQLAGIEQI